jgi:hypothetical protein
MTLPRNEVRESIISLSNESIIGALANLYVRTLVERPVSV